MTYRVLLPVTNCQEYVEDVIAHIPDLTRLILVDNFDNPQVLDLCKGAREKGATLYYFPFNLGLAASWNIGLRAMAEEAGVEFVIILSASAFLSGSLQAFVDAIMEQEARAPNCRYIASSTASLHCFAQTRLSLELGGYFDENFWPIYYEDTDYCQRSRFNGTAGRTAWCGLEGLVRSRGASIALREPRLNQLWEANACRIIDYYKAKWGGAQLDERYARPFNDSRVGVNEWRVRSAFNNTLVGEDHWLPPERPYQPYQEMMERKI